MTKIESSKVEDVLMNEVLYLLLLVLVDERWLSCFDLVNLKAHTRSLVNERYI